MPSLLDTDSPECAARHVPEDLGDTEQSPKTGIAGVQDIATHSIATARVTSTSLIRLAYGDPSRSARGRSPSSALSGLDRDGRPYGILGAQGARLVPLAVRILDQHHASGTEAPHLAIAHRHLQDPR